MTEHHPFALEELTRVTHAERLAQAEADRLAWSARADKRSLRIVLADALRLLASRIDRESTASTPTDRRLARAC